MVFAQVDDEVVSADVLWWPEMNFDQFRWTGCLGTYELEIPRGEFTDQLESAWEEFVLESHADDLLVPDRKCPIKDAGYPPLEELPDHPAALFEAVRVSLWSDLLGAFLPFRPCAARFMVNSIDAVCSSPTTIVVRGRGYHGAPGFASK